MEINLQQARADSYRLLAACFYPPDTFWQNREQFFSDLCGALRPISPPAAEFAADMGLHSAQCSEQDLSVEYAKLFVGPYELIAPPYGSVYLDEGKRVMGDSTMAVIKMYQEYGLKIADDFKELPDHIAVELEFMYYLSYKEIEAEQQINHTAGGTILEAQVRFMTALLGPFVVPFCKRIRETTTSTFYKVLAACVATFIKDDRQFLMQHTASTSEHAGQ